MCNILSVNCSVCEDSVEMHLEDYATNPEEIRIYCQRHIPEGRVGVLWGGGDSGRVFVEALTENAFAHRHGNYPNDASTEEIGEAEDA